METRKIPLAIDSADATALIDFASALVRTESPSGREEADVRLAARTMEELGFDEVLIDGFGNALGRIGNSGPSILFDSHLDTVEAGDAAAWRVPPFSGLIGDGRLHGRGSVDMKSGAAASIFAAALARDAGLVEGRTVYVSCTVLEEDCDGENLVHLFRETGIRPDRCVVCEPSNARLAVGHKGKAQVAIRTEGVSAHGSTPELGVNAVYPMAAVIARVERQARGLETGPEPRGTLALTRVASEAVSLNAVPAACEVYLDRRLAPGESVADFRRSMDDLVAGTGASWRVGSLRRRTWTGLEVRYEPLHEAWRLEDGDPFLDAAVEAYRDAFGAGPDPFLFWNFSTNAVATTARSIPTLGFGPGDPALAHMVDESCPLEQILGACRLYQALIARLVPDGEGARG
ncbi:MAG: YgeY family selenium metabolism-linked hydrolase [Spirochaetales bacterium]|nr:YgeY family selenium metabolism-linked hydrolase [Spirochaetales bacterium]